jgi:hypothetical protein
VFCKIKDKENVFVTHIFIINFDSMLILSKHIVGVNIYSLYHMILIEYFKAFNVAAMKCKSKSCASDKSGAQNDIFIKRQLDKQLFHST